MASGSLACAIALGSLAIACGSDEPAPTEPAAPAETTPAAPAAPVEPAAPAPTADAGDPGGTVTDGVLPEGFPSDVPVYPGATPGASMTMPGLGVFATFQTDAAVDAILTHYRGELAKSGWSVSDTPDGDGVDGAKGSRSVTVRARASDSGGTEIAISLSAG